MTVPAKMDFDYRILKDHAFGLVDASVLDELPGGIEGEPVVPGDLAGGAHLMPRLLDFRAMKQETAERLLNALRQAHMHDEAPPLSLLIDTAASAEQFTAHWNRMQLVSPRAGTRSWLRLHDPRVLHQVLRILTADQQRTLFGKSTSFTYWIGEEWVRVARQEPPAGDFVDWSGAAANWDWPRIERIGIINRALERAGVRGAAEQHSQAMLAEHLMTRARIRHSLTADSDLIEFVARGVASSPTFDQHPRISTALRPDDDGSDESTLADRLALIDEQIWNTLRGDTAAQQQAEYDRTQKM